MNTYEAKQAARKARYEARAGQAQTQSDTVASQASRMADAIPMGQPILVGHHSERSDRRYRERISRGFEKSFELQKKAEHYANKAASVGKGGISSDDPAAVDKLQAKLSRPPRPKSVTITNSQHRLPRQFHFNQTASAIPGGIQFCYYFSKVEVWEQR